jgi:indolepyruvate ferredoxin oxidoreductase alpha subunit
MVQIYIILGEITLNLVDSFRPLLLSFKDVLYVVICQAIIKMQEVSIMEKFVLLGDEAVALGAIHAGISGSFSYPGTPATQIQEFVQRTSRGDVRCHWSANEKAAYEEALGVSYVGKRALVSMKHVGLNVAADAFVNSAITGVDGGLVVVTGDDPGMHSSQNEQDSRFYAQFAKTLCFEPSSQQEAYDMTREAFKLSEEFILPLMIRLVTRLAHSRANIKTSKKDMQRELKPTDDIKRWTLMPANARVRFKKLNEQQSELIGYSEDSPWNELNIKPGAGLGVIASGIGFNYLKEVLSLLSLEVSYLKINIYPLPLKKVKELISSVSELLVVEEGYPLIEGSLRGLLDCGGTKIRGKMSGDLPITGELTPETVCRALGGKEKVNKVSLSFQLPIRPPALCQGCPHIDTYAALKDALADYPDVRVFSDIGCYTLGFLPPYQAIHSCVEMGASIGMAKGAAEAGLYPSLAVIGDSTFVHSGMTGLVGAARNNTDMTVVIMDNDYAAMTGGQKTVVSGEGLVNLVKGLGVDPAHVRVIIPLPKNRKKNAEVFRKEITHHGLSVIISRRACVVAVRKKKEGGEE